MIILVGVLILSLIITLAPFADINKFFAVILAKMV